MTISDIKRMNEGNRNFWISAHARGTNDSFRRGVKLDIYIRYDIWKGKEKIVPHSISDRL